MPIVVPNLFQDTSETPPVIITEPWLRHNWDNFSDDLATTDGVGFGQAGSSDYPWGLNTQNHLDVRTFAEPGWTLSSGVTMTQGYQSAYNHWPGASVSLPSGNSTLTATISSTDFTEFWDGRIALALPSFPLASITLANSFLDLSSDGFVHDITSVAWSTSLTSPIAGHSALTWMVTNLGGADLTRITGVRLRIATTAPCTVVLMALRLLDPHWVQTNMDFDTSSHQLRSTIPLTGDPALVSMPSNQVLPILWRSDNPSGSGDPKPINGEVGFLFNTGSQTQGNTCTLYMRNTNDTLTTQGDIQGLPQNVLTGQPQPSFETNNTPNWISFMVRWGLSPLIQITNSAQPSAGYQFTTGFTPAANTTYLCVCQLQDANARLRIYGVNQTTLGLGGGVYPLFDTLVIPDAYMFPRRAGRLGFQAALNDGDAYMGAIRPRSLLFAEYRSRPLKSLTPVKGARLYVDTTSDQEMFTGWSALPDSNASVPLLISDTQRYLSTSVNQISTKITVTTPSTVSPTQGIVSNVLSAPGDSVSGITDFSQFHISFALWVPGVALSAGGFGGAPVISAALLGAYGDRVPIDIAAPNPDQWTTYELPRPFATPYPQSGLYQLVLNYNGTIGTTWWIDNVSVHQHAIDWSGRSVVDDPWHSNYAPWTIFHDLVNSDSDGVLFHPMGTELQIRGSAFRQDAMILSTPKVVPHYGQLGRLTWPENAPTLPPLPSPSIATSHVGRVYTFDGTASSSSIHLGGYFWSFGDGTFGTGPVATHTYASEIPTGTQVPVSLTVIDALGQANGQSATSPTLVVIP